jgi:hypothetical protein
MIVVIKSLLCQTSEAEKSFNIIVAIKKQPVMPNPSESENPGRMKVSTK